MSTSRPVLDQLQRQWAAVREEVAALRLCLRSLEERLTEIESRPDPPEWERRHWELWDGDE